MTEKKRAQGNDQVKIEKIRKQLEDSARDTLINYKESGVISYVEILAAGENSCNTCRAMNGKKFLLEAAIKNPPLPVKNCTGVFGYCRCCYVPVVD